MRAPSASWSAYFSSGRGDDRGDLDALSSASGGRRGPRLPDPLALLAIGVLFAAALTWTLPAGEYARELDPEADRTVVVPGSFHSVERAPVGPFEAFVALPRGMVDAAEIIFLVFLVGGAFAVVDRTGALRWGLEELVGRLRSREMLVLPISCLAFGTGGLLFNMHEEIIAMVPALLVVTRRLRLDPVVAVGMSLGAAAVGSAFSPINPFQVGIAQKIAEVPLLSGGGYRSLFLVAALGIWAWGLSRYARRTRGSASAAPPAGSGADQAPIGTARLEGAGPGCGRSFRLGLILTLVVVTFAVYVAGVMRLEWGFNEMSGLFALMGIVAGLVGHLGLDGTAKAYTAGFREMAFAAILIGVARAIYLVLADGRIVDTLVHALLQPIQGLPGAGAAVGMLAAHTLIHVPVPSVSGHAVLTLPILVPLSDLLGLAREITILAYQYGAGLCDILTPTNGALMAILVAAGVPYGRWLRFVVPMWAALTALAVTAILVAAAIGWG